MAGLIGVFGGTFDPPHLGHLILADEARQALKLEKVLWLPAGDPPHKPERPLSAAAIRAEMVEAAIAGDPGFVLSRVDLDRPGPHYTVDGLDGLRRQGWQQPLVYLMGSDSLRDLPSWRSPRELLARCQRVGVLRRPGSPVDLQALAVRLPELPGKVHFFEAPHVGISGHDIRARVGSGRAFRYLVLPRVAELIERYQLYQ